MCSTKNLCLFQTCFSSKPLLVAVPKLYSKRNFETLGYGNGALLIIYSNTKNTAVLDGDTKYCQEMRHPAAFPEHSHLHHHHTELSPTPPFLSPGHSVLIPPSSRSSGAQAPRSIPAGHSTCLPPAPALPKHWPPSAGVSVQSVPGLCTSLVGTRRLCTHRSKGRGDFPLTSVSRA